MNALALDVFLAVSHDERTLNNGDGDLRITRRTAYTAPGR